MSLLSCFSNFKAMNYQIFSVTIVIFININFSPVSSDFSRDSATLPVNHEFISLNTNDHGRRNMDEHISGNNSLPPAIPTDSFPKPYFKAKQHPEFSSGPMKKNCTNGSKDTSAYYKILIDAEPSTDHHFWVDMNNQSAALPQSHHQNMTVGLPFKFQFYGRQINDITIKTEGFLYTGDISLPYLPDTQYIAPLMGSFHTLQYNNSFVRFELNSTAFTVTWENVTLIEHPNAGNFSFQVTLRESGDIIFMYKNIPDIVNKMNDDSLKIGIADSYSMEVKEFFNNKRTINKYDCIAFDTSKLRNWTVIHLTPLPTCSNRTTCESCLSTNAKLHCYWCDNRCSSGEGRREKEWMQKNCETRKINETKFCSTVKNDYFTDKHEVLKHDGTSKKKGISNISIVLIFASVSGFAFFVWILYAYRNPHSTSGQILIRYRPSQWSSLRKSEVRYTAATVHM